jgi:RNA polymerase sigma factor for flagellar operon FliA
MDKQQETPARGIIMRLDATATAPVETDEKQAQDALVLEHLDLVQHVVNQVSMRYPMHTDREELWNAGALGLVQAARRYRPEMGVPFFRYAVTRIRGAIIDSTRDGDWVARSVRRGVREVRDLEERLEAERGERPADEELAPALNITLDELQSRRVAAVASNLMHLDDRTNDEMSLGDSVAEEHEDAQPEGSLENREILGTVRTAIKYLPRAQRDVVIRHYLQGEMLRDIADTMGVTEARVSQIASEAVNAIRSYLATQYEGVPSVSNSAPGKRTRAAYVSFISAASTWRERMRAADDLPWREAVPAARAS